MRGAALLAAAGAALGVPAVTAASTDPPEVMQRPPLVADMPPAPPGPRPVAGPDRARGASRLPAMGPAADGEFLRGISDGQQVGHPDPAIRRAALRRARAVGARVIRVQARWRKIASASPPAGDLRDPTHPAYDWRILDDVVRDVRAFGLAPLITVAAAPGWAEGPGKWAFAPAGSWAPVPARLGEFATAIARRYSGATPDPLIAGGRLPRVRRWQAWNEPNLPRYLAPQWTVRDGRWVPYAPGRYREMLRAFADAVHGVHADNIVATAGTAPNGESLDGAGRMTPVRFWSAFFCLAPPPGVRRIGCRGGIPRFDAIAHHPLSVADPGDVGAPLDIAIRDLSKLRRLVAAAKLPRRPMLWVTEVNWDSAPESRTAVPRARQWDYVARGLAELRRQGARLVMWHFLVDRAPGPRSASGPRNHPAGLWGPDGRRPFADAFAAPLATTRLDVRTVRVWGAIPDRAPGLVRVEQRTPLGWRTLRTVRARADGTLTVTLALRGRPPLRLRSARAVTRAVRVTG